MAVPYILDAFLFLETFCCACHEQIFLPPNSNQITSGMSPTTYPRFRAELDCDAGPVERNARLAAAHLLTDRDHQAIGVDVLSDPSAKGFLRLLNAVHVVLDHPFVERIKFRDAQTGSAPTGT